VVAVPRGLPPIQGVFPLPIHYIGSYSPGNEYHSGNLQNPFCISGFNLNAKLLSTHVVITGTCE